MTEILISRLSKNVALPKYETDGSSGMDRQNTEIPIKITWKNINNSYWNFSFNTKKF